MADNFKPTKNFENYISFDDNSRRFMLARGNRVFSYDVLKGYELVEDNSRAKGLARAYSLDFLNPDGVRPVRSMKVRLVLEDAEEFIPLVITPTKSNTVLYKKLADMGQRIMEKLAEIQPDNCTKPAPQPSSCDYTEELRRLHGLMTEGIITQEEFDAKKKQLLGL